MVRTYFRTIILIIVLYGGQSKSVNTPAGENELLQPGKVVNTEIGPIEGVQLTGNTGKKVTAYLGVPYAEPPLGELRFRPPIPYQGKFEETFKANQGPRTCFQSGPKRLLRQLQNYGFNMKRPFSEDCLQLNIYVPENVPEKASVLVYFHGGAFYLGSSLAFYQRGETLAAEENIIVVTVNYRIGVLGFLSLGNEEAPGNAGLLDQQLALIFVHENIAAFGGNPSDVTIAGTSAGSVSAAYHILSPGSTGLFAKVILQSGVPANPWAYGSLETVVKKSYQVATDTGYKGKMDPSSVAKYLRSLDPTDLNEANHFRILGVDENIILPTVDGTFLRKDPDHAIIDALASGGKNVSVLIGNTANEAGNFVILTHPELFLRYEDNAINFYEYEEMIRSYGFGDEEAFAITQNYAKKEKQGDPHYIRDLAIQTVADYLFVCDTNEFSEILADHGLKVYRYIFDVEHPFVIPGFPKFKGADHGADAIHLFGFFLRPSEDGLDDKTKAFLQLSKKVIRRFGNFIKQGDPNIEGVEPHFPLFKTQQGSALIMKPGQDEIVHHPRGKECVIFREIVPLVDKFTKCKGSRANLHHRNRIHHRHHGQQEKGHQIELGPDLYMQVLRKHNYFIKRPFSEDCLKLNIYVPQDCPPKASVLVYIHGGAFYAGSSTARYKKGETLASDQKVIVVNFNYRLGVLGFLSLGHQVAPGNVGLMDQQLVLKFVRDNIEAFGGNPFDVTLAGTDAGAASVGFQIFSPGSQGLFQKVIMQSGAPYNPPFYAVPELVIEKSNQIALNMGYKGEKDAVKVAEYLRSLDPEDLYDGYASLCPEKNQNMIVPTLDGQFLTKHPEKALKEASKSQKLTMLIGTSSNEGDIFAYVMRPELIYGKREDIDIFLFQRVLHDFGFSLEEALKAAKKLDQEQIGDADYIRRKTTEAVADTLFSCDIKQFSRAFADHGSTVYRYVYDAKVQFPLFGKTVLNMALHGMDSTVLFGSHLRPDNEKGAELTVHKRTIQRFGNFIKHGHPDLDKSEHGFPVFTSEERAALLIGTTHDEIVKRYRGTECSVFHDETTSTPKPLITNNTTTTSTS